MRNPEEIIAALRKINSRGIKKGESRIMGIKTALEWALNQRENLDLNGGIQ